MSRERRREMVDRQYPALSTVRQCALLGISRSSVYYRPRVSSPKDLALMKQLDQQYLATPFYGSRRMRMKVWLDRQGHPVNRKRVRRLMRTMGLQAIYRRPRTSQPGPGHKVYPYLLGAMEITMPNQVWAADITYIPMARGFLYLVAIMDWYSRYVVAWRLSNTLDADFCVETWRRRWARDRRKSSTLTKAVSSPVRPSLNFWSATESESAWMGKAGIATTYSWSGCGGR